MLALLYGNHANFYLHDYENPASMRLILLISCLIFFKLLLQPCVSHRPPHVKRTELDYVSSCERMLYPGHYRCPTPGAKGLFDQETQDYKNCTKNNKAYVPCLAGPFIRCRDGDNSRQFQKQVTCRYTNGYYLDTALLLSVFLGMFGADRCYLGYLWIGMFKLLTFGFLFVGQIIDIVLIATQALPPADGSYYVIPRFGPHIIILKPNAETIYVNNTDFLV